MKKVLLIDDVPEQLMAYRRLLHGRFDVITSSDGTEALDILKRDADIAIIVSDMSMPHISGIDLFVRAAEIAPHAVRIMLSGNTDINATVEAINRGQVFRYLQKPCKRDELIETIEAGLKLNALATQDKQTNARSEDDVPNQSHIADWLRPALHHNEVRPYYQPIVELSSGAIAGSEALARWWQPVEGWISPGVFIPVAEQYGLMAELGRNMLAVACCDAADWNSKGYDKWISVNVSVTQFADGGIIRDVENALAESGLEATSLTLELTESVMIKDQDSIVDKLKQLRNIGVKIAIDDFGTGYSSLSYLKHLPFDHLKIDRSFIKDIDQDERDVVFVRAMLDLAQKLNFTVVAEGIERFDQHRILQDLGCNFGQGFLYEKAVDAARFSELLATGVVDQHQNHAKLETDTIPNDEIHFQKMN